ncbi:hypothetical protein GGI35DRAFT_472882 [Trichoderma velutinum]
MLVGSSCGFWLFITIFRILKVLWSGHSDVLQLTIRLMHLIKLQPGCYFYIFFPAFWLNSYKAITELTFLLSRRGNYIKAISQLREGQIILLDGPYGINYELQTYKTAILVAKGMGIAVILPLALSLAARRHYDDCVRENLETLSQRNRAMLKEISSATGEELERLEQLVALQALDPNNELFVIWYGFPRYQTGPAPFKKSAFWKCLNPNPNKPFNTTIISKLKEERKLLASSFAVIVSGDESFRAIIRSGTVKAIDSKSIAFVETEFQPHGELVQVTQGQAIKLKRKKQSRDLDGSLYSAISESSMYSI